MTTTITAAAIMSMGGATSSLKAMATTKISAAPMSASCIESSKSC